MKRIIFLLLIVIGCCLPASAHDFFISITKIEYNPESQKFELAMKVTAHDLEKTLEDQGIETLYLGSEKEIVNAGEYIKSYIINHFGLKVNGHWLDLNYIGKELELNENLWIYLESEKTDHPGQIEIKNNVLTGSFDKQQNHHHLKYKGQIYSLVLMKDRSTGTIYKQEK